MICIMSTRAFRRIRIGQRPKGGSRVPTAENYRLNQGQFKAVLPMKLKDKVSNRPDVDEDYDCLTVMTLMFSCLKKNNFDEAYCSKEISDFDNCNKAYIGRSQQFTERGIEFGQRLSMRKGRYPSKELNVILSKFKQPTSSQ
ncbi:hypothetical protein ACOME3_003355 [Neoechinorhynchus agilis]